MAMSKYTTKATRIGPKVWGCRVYLDGTLIVEGRADSRAMIGPVFRDLMRTLDKLGGDAYTSACRKRKFKDGALSVDAMHIWHIRHS